MADWRGSIQLFSKSKGVELANLKAHFETNSGFKRLESLVPTIEVPPKTLLFIPFGSIASFFQYAKPAPYKKGQDAIVQEPATIVSVPLFSKAYKDSVPANVLTAIKFMNQEYFKTRGQSAMS